MTGAAAASVAAVIAAVVAPSPGTVAVPSVSSAGAVAVASVPSVGTVAAVVLLLAAAGVVAKPPGARSRLGWLSGSRGELPAHCRAAARRLLVRAERSRRLAVTTAAGAAGGLATLGWGPVAGVAVGGYAAAALAALLRRRAAGNARRELLDSLDGVAMLIGDLRAGLPPTAALGAALPLLIGVPATRSGYVADLESSRDDGPRGRIIRRLVAAWRVADQTGAPLADVLERLDAQVRAGQRAAGLAEAHAAGARATAILLAGLPAAGIALGYGIGADPVGALLTTPAGAVCGVLAVVLQLLGLAWARRLAHIDPEQVELGGAR